MSYDPSRCLIGFMDFKSSFEIYINNDKKSELGIYVVKINGIKDIKNDSKFIVSEKGLLALIKMNCKGKLKVIKIFHEDFNIEKCEVDINELQNYLCLLSECQLIE